ncbi:MAG: CRISPR-associated protein Cas4 [Coriobacteriales bacterium]|nr:CRISPR-associated protein Cas4 [Coriobacteriales bacterium]
MYSDDELLPLSGLQHLAYCERQCALIHMEQVWVESEDTLRGEFFHERVDTVGYACADGVRAERRVRLTSKVLGLYGIADIVEFSSQDNETKIVPVEYKVGRPKLESWDRLQVAAQALCLEEMYGVRVNEGCLFYGETRRRERVSIGESLRDRVSELALSMHQMLESQVLPAATYGSRCRRCSLQDECMPQASAQDVRLYWERMGEGW